VKIEIFVLIGFLSLVRLQRQCALAGLAAIRAANAIVVSLGLLFIFFAFQEQGTNYLFPILSGILDWGSLIPYLSLDLFFRPPFLAAWMFVYALSYYGLARSGRESWVLYLTAVFGAVYAANTLGAVAGTLLTAFFIVQEIGLRASVWSFGVINLLCGAVALALADGQNRGGERERGERRERKAGASSPHSKRWREFVHPGVLCREAFGVRPACRRFRILHPRI